jgi:hypothetical protein
MTAPTFEPVRWGLGRVLRLATGVREDVLARVPSERARYTSMGGVVVGTATMAMLSMAAALYWVFGGFRLFIVFAVPIWGLFILSLDRWLISSTSIGEGAQAAGKVGARLLLSVGLGVVLAEPLVLGIYGTAIEERVAASRQAELTTRESDLRVCNPIPGTQEAASGVAASDRCKGLRLALGGASPDALQKQLETTQGQAKTLQETVTKVNAEYARLEHEASLECNGTSGPGRTGRVGVGVNCKRLRGKADQFRTDNQIEDNGKKLVALNEKVKDLGDQIGVAQDRYGDEIKTAIDKDLALVAARQQKVGLLERFRALHALVGEDSYVAVTEWAIRVFFILVDALPVIIKVMSGRTPYDRMLEERVAAQEHDNHLRAVEQRRWSREQAELTRAQTETQHRNERALIAESNRIHRANLDERGNLLVNALEEHYLRTAIGPANRIWHPDGQVMDGPGLGEVPTQEIIIVPRQADRNL